MSEAQADVGVIVKATKKHGQLFMFLLAGLPSFVLAVPLNYVLVEHAALRKDLAYAIVLVFQVLVNFVICYWFVFKRGSDKPWYVQMWQFTAGVLAFRVGDWIVYNLAVNYLHVPYLLMQFINVIVFALLKFRFARAVMGRRKAA